MLIDSVYFVNHWVSAKISSSIISKFALHHKFFILFMGSLQNDAGISVPYEKCCPTPNDL